MPHRYAIYQSLVVGTSIYTQESDDLEIAKLLTDDLAKTKCGYFFVVDRQSKTIVYVCSVGPIKATDPQRDADSR